MSFRISRLLLLLICTVLVGCRTTSTVREAPATSTPAPLVAATPPPTSPPAKPTAGAGPSASATGSPGAGPVALTPPTASPVAAGSPTAAGPASPVACQYGPTRKLAEVQNRSLKEASALVASQRWPGVYWTLNDSGNDAEISAVDEQGRDRGTFKVQGADNIDWESMQLGPGRDGGQALYIGDTGDNDGKRRELQIYRVPEPEPLAPGARSQNGRTAEAETFKIAYPAGARDAEALIVHPKTGETLIVTKDTPGKAAVFRVPPPLDSRHTMRLDKVADLDLARAGVRADVVTDATITTDARRITIRTYGSGLEYDVPPDAQLASIWDQTPRVFRIEDPPQGEGVSYRLDGNALISIGEDNPTFLWQTPRQC